MSSKFSLLVTCFVLVGLSIDPRAATGQVIAADTTSQATSDTQPGLTDTGRASSDTAPPTTTGADTAAPPDTAARDTMAGSDTLSSRDTTASSDTTKAADTTAARTPTAGAATASAEPADSILMAACSGAPPVARDLLVIVFAPEAVEGERAEAAQSVEGKLLGPVGLAEPGAYYLRVPSGGEEYRLRSVADQLIQLPHVRQVGSRACPALPPPETEKPS